MKNWCFKKKNNIWKLNLPTNEILNLIHLHNDVFDLIFWIRIEGNQYSSYYTRWYQECRTFILGPKLPYESTIEYHKEYQSLKLGWKAFGPGEGWCNSGSFNDYILYRIMSLVHKGVLISSSWQFTCTKNILFILNNKWECVSSTS